MRADELIAKYPRLYHLTTPGAWEVIRRHGLLSTEALLRHYCNDETEVQKRIRRRRDSRETLLSDAFGRVVLNDNKPIHLGKLARCLDDGLTPEDWLAELNRRVFFWVSEKRVQDLNAAEVNHSDPREMLVLNTASVVEACRARLQIAPINTGSTLYDPARRGKATFTTIDAMPYAAWRRLREATKSSPDQVVEVVVFGCVPDVERHLVKRRRI